MSLLIQYWVSREGWAVWNTVHRTAKSTFRSCNGRGTFPMACAGSQPQIQPSIMDIVTAGGTPYPQNRMDLDPFWEARKPTRAQPSSARSASHRLLTVQVGRVSANASTSTSLSQHGKLNLYILSHHIPFNCLYIITFFVLELFRFHFRVMAHLFIYLHLFLRCDMYVDIACKMQSQTRCRSYAGVSRKSPVVICHEWIWRSSWICGICQWHLLESWIQP